MRLALNIERVDRGAIAGHATVELAKKEARVHNGLTESIMAFDSLSRLILADGTSSDSTDKLELLVLPAKPEVT